MKTNNFFDLDRFIGLLKQDILFNYKSYLYVLAGLSIGIYVIAYLMIQNNSAFTSYQSVYYILYSLLLGATMGLIGMSFPAFRDQVNTCKYLLMPGSAFEKLLVQFMVRFVFFIPLALILLKVCIFLAVTSMAPNPKIGFDPIFVTDFSYSELFTRSEALQNNPFRDLAYLLVMFAGSIYFKRHAVVKTLGVIFFLPVTLFLLVKFSGGQINWAKMSSDYLNGHSFFLSLAPVFIGLLLLSLPWAYFKLKGKEL